MLLFLAYHNVPEIILCASISLILHWNMQTVLHGYVILLSLQ